MNHPQPAAPSCTDFGMDALGTDDARLNHLRHAIDHASHLLPSQGPIEVFVHHNTLHAFEDLPFHEAVVEGRRVLGGQPYWPEARYRDMLEAGRINLADLEDVVRADLVGADSESLCGLSTQLELRLAMLRFPCSVSSDAELRWMVAETDALDQFRPEVSLLIRERMVEQAMAWVEKSHTGQAADVRTALLDKLGRPSGDWRETRRERFTLDLLWRVCRLGVESLPAAPPVQPHFVRPREVLLRATGEDTDRFVNELLVRFSAAFLDQGYADWALPHREKGFYNAFLQTYRHRKGPPDRWLRGLRHELVSLWQSQTPAEQAILDLLELLDVRESDYDDFVLQTLLALRGWAGILWQLESSVPWAVHQAPQGSLCEYLAVRLILEHQAILYVGAEKLGCDSSAREILELARRRTAQPTSTSTDRRAFQVFQVAQVLGWHPERLLALSSRDWEKLIHEIESFSGTERRRLLHEAYERHYRVRALDAFAIHRKRCLASDHQAIDGEMGNSKAANKRRAFQIVCCIDDREESFRRHLEEIDPEVGTYGAAGFFAVVMYYRGAADAYFKALCPAIVTPRHYVTEDVGYTFEGVNRQRASSRQRLGKVTHRVHAGSRTFVGGIVTGLLGSLATAPLVARVLFPWLTARLRAAVGQLLQPPPVTQLQLERYQSEPGSHNGHVGFNLEEMAGIVARLLEDIGLTKTEDFSPLVIICGHGAASLNNPHESAYCCGACAGKRGGPNARAFAQMANDWRIRARLKARGLVIPDDTTFLGSYHDTTNDSVVWYDLDRMPASHRTLFERAQTAIETARQRNAHERCRRFASAELNLSYEEALRHAETRGEDLSQVRPEYNHATNALCIVGRRELSRGLFLDRRAFLTSYDPTQDDSESSILFRILAAAIPVCAGISLEYYFSCVDNVLYGSGSKLPHNLASLLGVMEGANSDLRTGLYQQMVEIHEPMRLLFVIETTPQAMLSIIARHDGIRKLCEGDWVQLSLIDPETSQIYVWRDRTFQPYSPTTDTLPVAPESAAWYQHQRGHRDFAAIGHPPVGEGACVSNLD